MQPSALDNISTILSSFRWHISISLHTSIIDDPRSSVAILNTTLSVVRVHTCTCFMLSVYLIGYFVVAATSVECISDPAVYTLYNYIQ